MPSLVEEYLQIALELNKHIDGIVDAYYGPRELAAKVSSAPACPAPVLYERCRELINSVDAGIPLDRGDLSMVSSRRSWIRAQLVGMLTTIGKLCGREVDYLDEVELCYGVRPRRVSSEEIEDALSALDRTMVGKGSLKDRLNAFRGAFVVSPEKLEPILGDLAELLRERTIRVFGLPEGERVYFETVCSQPWSGFNYYLGGFRSRVAINVDLPVLSTSLAHLVAHEAYPGHHSEHSNKEAGLVKRLSLLEESIFLVGTPQCLLSEGLADLGVEMLLGDDQFSIVSELMSKRGIPYPDQELEATKGAFETLGRVRANAAWDLHHDRKPKDSVIDMLEREALLSRPQAEKSVEFLTDPIWRAYVTCYVEGFQLVRSFVGDSGVVDQSVRELRFRRLLTEQMIPSDLS